MPAAVIPNQMATNLTQNLNTPIPNAPFNIDSLAKVSFGYWHLLPAHCGVYFAIDNADRVWYIGRATKSLRERLSSHEKSPEFITHGVSKIAYCFVETDKDCIDLEQRLIEYFQPPLNLQLKTTPHIDLKLTPEQEIERFFQLKIQMKAIEAQIEMLKPNIVSQCVARDGKIVHPLGSIYTQVYKTWQFSKEAEELALRLKHLHEYEKAHGIATVKSESIGPIVKLKPEPVSNELAALSSFGEESSSEPN